MCDVRWSQLNLDGRGETMDDGRRLTTNDAEVDTGGSSEPQTGPGPGPDAAVASIPSHCGRCPPSDLTQNNRVDCNTN